MKVKHCPACKGTGEVPISVHPKARRDEYIPRMLCSDCNGTGRVKATKPKATKP